MTQVRYTDAIGDWTVRTCDLQDHLHHLRSDRGITTRCEYLEHDSPTVPYFDFDQTQIDPVAPDDVLAAADLCRRTICEIFGPEPSFDFDSGVARASRHGYVPSKGVYKISLRFWVKGFKILPQHMAALIGACTPPDLRDVFDLSIYSSKRLLACVGGIKGNGDDRVLQAAEPWMEEWSVCQRLVGTEINVDMTEEVTSRALPSRTTSLPPGGWPTVGEALKQAGFVDPVYVGKRENSISFTCALLSVSCPCCPHVHDRQVSHTP